MNVEEREVGKLLGKRGLGLGFGEGNAFHILSKEPNRGLINQIPFTENFLNEISVKMTAKNNQSILAILIEAVREQLPDKNEEEVLEVTKDILALTLPDLLVDINITRFKKIRTKLLGAFPEATKKILMHYGLSAFCDDAGKRFLRSIVTSKYSLFAFEEKEQKIKEAITKIDEHLKTGSIELIDDEVLAYLLPAILDRLPDQELRIAAFEIANHVDSKFLAPLGDKDYFTPKVVAASSDKIVIKNTNKRSLQFFAPSSNTVIKVRGDQFKKQHTHFHFERDGEEHEYDLDGQRFDGELHTVFEQNHKGKIRLMAIGFPLKVIAEENPRIAGLLQAINELEEVRQWRASGKKGRLELNTTLANAQQVFVDYLKQANGDLNLLFHSWGSLRSDTYGFRAGLRFFISPTAITLSEQQYRDLKEIFGEMNKDLTETDKVDPIDRKAGYRKERVELSKQLEEKITNTSIYRPSVIS